MSTTQTHVPFHRPWLGPEEEAEVLDTLRSGWLTTGPKTKRFEGEFATYAKAPHAIAVNSCTAALHVALVASNIGPGDEVIVPPLTFAATANVVVHVGATPIFADVLPDTLNIDPEQVRKAVTPRTKAIIPVHYIGQPADLDAIHAIACEHGLTVIEDAAHATETVYRGRKVGSISPFTAFSFYATKNLTTGEGGMLTTLRDDVADRCRVVALHGMSRDAWKRYEKGGSLHYDIVEPGFKYNMTDLQASLGLHQLAKVEGFRVRRKQLVERYHEAFEWLRGIDPLMQAEGKGDVNAYHLYVVRVTPEAGRSRDEVGAMLQAEGVGVSVHFRALHLHPYYRDRFGLAPEAFPVARKASDEILSLPLFPKMTDAEQDHVIAALRRVVKA